MYISLDDLDNLVRNGIITSKEGKEYKEVVASQVRKTIIDFHIANGDTNFAENYDDCMKEPSSVIKMN